MIIKEKQKSRLTTKKDMELILTNQIKMETEALRNMFEMKLQPILYPIQPLVLRIIEALILVYNLLIIIIIIRTAVVLCLYPWLIKKEKIAIYIY
jgi:hypothetical protein